MLVSLDNSLPRELTMAVRFSEGSPMEQFQAGRSLAGPNPLGTFIQGLLGTVNQLQGARIEQKLKTRGEIETQQALLPMKEASAMRLMQEKARLFPPQPRALSGDVAGRLSLASQGEKFVERAKSILFPSGTPESFRRDVIGAARSRIGRATGISAVPTFPFVSRVSPGEAQDVEFYVKRAIDAQLRAETGAAVSPGELDRLTQEFMANAVADPRSAFIRLDELGIGLRKTRLAIDPTGHFSQLAPSPFEPSFSEDLSGLSDEEILRGLE